LATHGEHGLPVITLGHRLLVPVGRLQRMLDGEGDGSHAHRDKR
jgi:hypothetical protein